MIAPGHHDFVAWHRILRQMVTSVSFAVRRSDWMLPRLLVFMLATQNGLETGAS